MCGKLSLLFNLLSLVVAQLLFNVLWTWQKNTNLKTVKMFFPSFLCRPSSITKTANQSQAFVIEKRKKRVNPKLIVKLKVKRQQHVKRKCRATSRLSTLCMTLEAVSVFFCWRSQLIRKLQCFKIFAGISWDFFSFFSSIDDETKSDVCGFYTIATQSSMMSFEISLMKWKRSSEIFRDEMRRKSSQMDN